MNGKEIVKQVSQVIGLYDSEVADLLDNRYYSQADLLELVNLSYREDIFPDLRQSSTIFERTIVLDNWQEIGEVETITSTALVTTEGIFSSYMVGGVVYNTTQEEGIKITEYTNPTTVELESAPTTWVATDELKIMTGFYAFSDALDDAVEIRSVGMKTTLTADYRNVDLTSSENINTDWFEDETMYNDWDIKGWEINLDDSTGTSIRGLVLKPVPTTPIANSVQIKYTQMPPKISLTTEPTLPKGHHEVLVYGAAMRAMIPLRLDSDTKNDIRSEFSRKVFDLKERYKIRTRIQFTPLRNPANKNLSRNLVRNNHYGTYSL